MSIISIYGIKNCNTMKKTFDWLNEHDVDYTFHDYKKSGVDADIIRRAFAQHGWENVINRKGMTWRKLPEDIRNTMDEAGALEIALEKSSIIKRPMLVNGDTIHLGFSEDTYSTLL